MDHLKDCILPLPSGELANKALILAEVADKLERLLSCSGFDTTVRNSLSKSAIRTRELMTRIVNQTIICDPLEEKKVCAQMG